MKKTMPSKKKKKMQSPRVDVEATRTLRTVGDQEAFYFYEAVGRPTGEQARNLSDFLERAKTVKTDSLMFHLQRGDFQNWVEKILGDSKLAKKLRTISPSNKDDVRVSICKAVENRIKELQELPIAILVDENSAVIQPYA